MRKSKQARDAKRAQKMLAASNQVTQEARDAVQYEKKLHQVLCDIWVQFMMDMWMIHLTDEDEMNGHPLSRAELEQHIQCVMELYDQFLPALTATGDDAIYIRDKLDERIWRGMEYSPDNFVSFHNRYPMMKEYFVTPQN